MPALPSLPSGLSAARVAALRTGTKQACEQPIDLHSSPHGHEAGVRAAD